MIPAMLRIASSVTVAGLLVFIALLYISERRARRSAPATVVDVRDTVESQPAETGERHVISGRVLDSRGRIPQDLVVMVTIPRSDGSGGAFPTPIGHDGSFVTRPLPPGTYALEARAPFGVPTGAAPEGAFALVTVSTSDVRNFRLKTTPSVTVTGRFRMESDNPRAAWPPHISVSAFLAFDGMHPVGHASGVGGPGGTFTLREVHGPRLLRCGYTLAPDSPWWPSHVLLDGTDITDIPTDFSQIGDRRLEVVFTQHPSIFVGTIADQRGRPAPHAVAVIFSADRALWHPWASTSHIVEANASGAFSLTARPGRYLAVALPPNAFASSRRARPDFEQLSRSASAVQIGKGERQLLPLRLMPTVKKW